MKLLANLALLIGIISAPQLARATVYNVDIGFNQPNGTDITGFIQTDGTQGVLSTSNIGSYSLSFLSQTLNNQNSKFNVLGSLFVAQGNELLYLQAQSFDRVDVGGGLVDLEFNNYVLGNRINIAEIDFPKFSTDYHYDVDSVLIGSAVPEASTWAMMLLGFGGLGLVAYRKAAKGSDGATMLAA